MLVLSRRIGETIRIGSEIELVVLDVNRGRVKLGFAGPRDVQVRRGELIDAMELRQSAPAVLARTSAGSDGELDAPSFAPLRAFRTASSAAAH